MSITLTLPPETERELRERAAASGRTVEGFIRDLVEREVVGPSGEHTAPGRRDSQSDALKEWYRELQELGPAQYEPGESEDVQAILAEADELAKAMVRRQGA
jgi:plasmid stability protein